MIGFLLLLAEKNWVLLKRYIQKIFEKGLNVVENDHRYEKKLTRKN